MRLEETFACVVVVLLVAACGPLGPLSGGALRGTLQKDSVPDWSFTAEHDTLQLETNPDDPYSVNTWCVGVADRLYVPTSMIRGPKSPAEREWVQHATRDPRARIRIGDALYERHAVRVTDTAEYDAARAALASKYELAPDDLDPEREIWIFRLDPRGS
jgi:hypothetical protein